MGGQLTTSSALAGVAVYLSRPERLDPDAIARCEALLDDEERERRARFYFERDRLLYLSAHALVREALSRHAAVDPKAWRFVAGVHGRPEIASPGLPTPLRFNLSHTAGLVACAVVVDRDVGIDVEYEARRGATVELADRFFSPLEAEDLRRLPVEAQRERFFVYWTLKEAYIKARGMGLALPLDHFSFHLAPDRPVAISFAPQLDDDPASWQFSLFRPTSDHRMALAVRASSDPRLEVSVEEIDL